MSTATLTRAAIAATCPSWCVDHADVDAGSVFHNGPATRLDGGIVVMVERLDDHDRPGAVTVFVELPDDLTPAQARATAVALVCAAELAEGR
jgi:uncharacterized protein DUF6907